MTAEITLFQVWYNISLCDFFISRQGQNTITEMLANIDESAQDALNQIADICEEGEIDLGTFADMAHEYGAQQLAFEFSLHYNGYEED